MANEQRRGFPFPLPGPLGDIAEILGHPADALKMGKKITRVGSARLKDANNDFTEADNIVRSIRIGKRRRRQR